jgi:hypothetical protein
LVFAIPIAPDNGYWVRTTQAYTGPTPTPTTEATVGMSMGFSALGRLRSPVLSDLTLAITPKLSKCVGSETGESSRIGE